MTALVPELQRALIDAAGRLESPRRRVIARHRTALVFAAGVLVCAAVAAAATAPWRPLLGDAQRGQPTVAISAPPADELGMLGVLRRSQTQTDRSPEVQAILKLLVGSADHGVRADTVRRLAVTPNGRPIVLVSEERYGDDVPGPTAAPIINPLCVFYPLSAVPMSGTVDRGPSTPAVTVSDPGGGLTVACFSAAQISDGRAVSRSQTTTGSHTWGLVPDGVAKVAVGDVTVRVRDNFFDAPSVSQGPRWLDDAGHDITPQR